MGRCFGIALFAQGLACWPQHQRAAESSLPAFRSMLTDHLRSLQTGL